MKPWTFLTFPTFFSTSDRISTGVLTRTSSDRDLVSQLRGAVSEGALAGKSCDGSRAMTVSALGVVLAGRAELKCTCELEGKLRAGLPFHQEIRIKM